MAAYPVLAEPVVPVVPAGVDVPGGFRAGAAAAWRTAEAKVPAFAARTPGTVPVHTAGGRWVTEEDPWTRWCDGFPGGLLWLLAARTGRDDLRRLAERHTEALEGRQFDRDVHDLGFLFRPTWHRWHEATGDPARDAVVVQAGRTLALRFDEKGRYLRSFRGPGSTFVDAMMNVGVVFHAARRTGDPALARIAHEHCRTTRRHLVRGDGSTAHEGVFDVATGAFLRHASLQGYRDDGTWARGLGWALHGFGSAYRDTGDRRYLTTARACADHYVERTGDALVCPNDWTEPAPARAWESSAAAVAAGGMWQLGCLLPDGAPYATYALRVLTRLCSPDFLSVDDPAWEGLLKHATYHESRGLGVDESVIWGDYWFLAALDDVERTSGWAASGSPASTSRRTDSGIASSG
jgi:unsaturated chondroitin disaccharide hydrolase